MPQGNTPNSRDKSPPLETPRRMSMVSKTVLAATLGEALEFYDFTAYGIFAVYVARAFFPTQGELLSLLLTIATFGIGFVTRPLGALVLGAYADRVGRKKVLTWTIWLMGIGTGAIAVLPTYDDIGIAAPMLLVLARLIQGFSAGGEVGSASLLIFEAAPKSHRGFAMSWQIVSRSIALIASGVVGYAMTATLSQNEIQQWGWRVTFAVGLLIVPVGAYIRNSINETLLPEKKKRSIGTIMLQLATPQQVPLVVIAVLFIGGIAVNQYLFLYMTTYALAILRLPATFAMLAPILSGFTGAVAGIYGGWAADRYGLNAINLVPRALMMIAAFPAFYFVSVSGNGWMFLAVVSVLSILHMASTALLNIVVAEAFPADIRAVGVSTTYALALAMFGGTAQFIVTGVIAIRGDPRAIAWAFIGSSLLSIVTYVLIRQRPNPDLLATSISSSPTGRAEA
jgi:MFS family permease